METKLVGSIMHAIILLLNACIELLINILLSLCRMMALPVYPPRVSLVFLKEVAVFLQSFVEEAVICNIIIYFSLSMSRWWGTLSKALAKSSTATSTCA